MSLMRMVMILMVVAFVIKDLVVINDPYVIRATAQCVALIAMTVWLLQNLRLSVMRRYWPLLCYLASLCVSLLWVNGELKIYVFLQVLSLSAVVLFFVAYFELAREDTTGAPFPQNILFAALLTVTLLSALFAVIWPEQVFYTLTSFMHKEIRFRGLFSNSPIMASVSGALLGIAYFGSYKWWLKTIAIGASGACLLLTQARTFWVAAFVAGALTLLVHNRAGRYWLAGGALLIALSVGLFISFGISLNGDPVYSFARVESISNLNGRTTIWRKSLDSLSQRPLFGFGFTVGSLALPPGPGEKMASGMVTDSDDEFGVRLQKARDVGKASLHNGYLQSLFDSGIIGTLFYLSIIVAAFVRIMRAERECNLSMALYVMIFFSVANFAETVISSAGMIDSLIFWLFAVYAMSIGKREPLWAPEQTGGAPYPDPMFRGKKSCRDLC